MAKTKIEWSDMSWNPVVGCTKCAAGCQFCYSERICYRFWKEWGREAPPNHFKVMLHPDRLKQPLKWRKPRMIFICSMGDLFHEDVPDEFIDRVIFIIGRAKQHTFQLLTKRPERMYNYFSSIVSGESGTINRIIKQLGHDRFHGDLLNYRKGHPLSNLWLGTSVSTQKDADENIPWILKTPAAIRFVSYEPALERIDFRGWLRREPVSMAFGFSSTPKVNYETNIDWLICGGESGTGARPMHPDWARSARDQCIDAGVPFFFKQWGKFIPYSQCSDKQKTYPHRRGLSTLAGNGSDGDVDFWIGLGKKKAGRILDGRTWGEMPK